MSGHHKYTTEGFVMKVEWVGEADGKVTLLTKDLGLIRVSVKSLRKYTNKHKSALTEFSKVLVSVVKGKEVWRLTNSLLLNNIFYDLRGNIESIRLLAKVKSLVGRLVIGEGEIIKLFLVMDFLYQNIFRIDKDSLPDLECFAVMNILSSLGYLPLSQEEEDLLKLDKAHDSLGYFKSNRLGFIKRINESLHATQL